MKLKKKMLMSSLVMLLISLLTLVTSTFAWFTSGKEGNVTGINFTAEASGGIQIAALPTVSGSGQSATKSWAWKTSLNTTDDLTTSLYPQLTVGNKLTPVSTTAAGLTAGTLYQMKNENNKATITEAKITSGSGENAGYYAIDLFIKNENNQDATITLKAPTTGETTAAGSEVKNHQTGTVVNDLTYATRVAFVTRGSNADPDAAYAIADYTGATTVTTANIWEPENTKHIAAATASKIATDGQASVTNGLLKVTVSGSEPTLDNNGFVPAGDFAAAVTTTSSVGSVEVCKIPANSTAKITVFIWVEGQDVDCLNAASNQTVDVNLYFVANYSA